MIEQGYRVPEVARLLGESRQIVYQALRRGEFPGAYKTATGGRTSPWIITESAIQAYRRSRR